MNKTDKIYIDKFETIIICQDFYLMKSTIITVILWDIVLIVMNCSLCICILFPVIYCISDQIVTN